MVEYSPLTCYICGETTDRVAVDKRGCLEDQQAAIERFKDKHGHRPEALLDVCPSCHDEEPHHTRNTKQKYGVIRPER